MNILNILSIVIGMLLVSGCTGTSDGLVDDTDSLPDTTSTIGDGTRTDSTTDTNTDTNSDIWQPQDTSTNEPLVAMYKDFNSQTEGESTLQMIKGGDVNELGIYADNNTISEVDGETALCIHADARVFMGRGYAVEFQLDMPQWVDMSTEDYGVSFDVFIPEALREYEPGVQFAFLKKDTYKSIYSQVYPMPSLPGWFNVAGRIAITPDGAITTGSVGMGVEDWQVNVIRIHVIFTGDAAYEYQEIQYCIDNILVYRPAD